MKKYIDSVLNEQRDVGVSFRLCSKVAMFSGFMSVLLMCATAGFSFDDRFSAEKQVGLAQELLPCLAQVEHVLQYDKGEAPQGGGWGERCPNCGRFHGNHLESIIKEERALQTPGFVLSPVLVATADTQTHPRFLREIRVHHGDEFVSANVYAYARDKNAVILKLSNPLPGIVPLTFQKGREGPFFSVVYSAMNGRWTVAFKSAFDGVSVPSHGLPFFAVPSSSVIMDAEGVSVALSMSDEVSVSEDWQGTPLDWSVVSSDEMTALLERLKGVAGSGLMRVSLGLRSPKTDPIRDQQYRFHYDSDEDDANATQRNALCVLLAPKLALVLIDLEPRVTSRLEHISIHHPEKGVVNARFVGSLKDYGAFFIEPETALSHELSLFDDDILLLKNRLLLAADLAMQGEQRVAYFSHIRIPAFKTGWKGNVYPEMANKTENIFLFDENMRLIALPIMRRDVSSHEGRHRSYFSRDRSLFMPLEYLRDIITNYEEHLDVANIPLSEEDENRLAWIGVDLQRLNRDLARANMVSAQTRDGQTGALVSHVYPGSPADIAGVVPGMILLRLRSPARPNPLEVRLDETPEFPMQLFWEHLDDLPEQYMDQIPSPWPSVENAFSRMLTDLGLGSAFIAEFFANGELVEKEFVVVPGPAHYNSANRYKSEVLGLTVRDLTYEVRRYLQRNDDEPGVVIARIEPGSRAAVAGIKPYELITHINNEPVKDVRDFEGLIEAGGDLSVSIKRLSVERLVKISGVAGKE